MSQQKETCVDEVQPLRANGANGHHCCSPDSDFSSVSRQKKNYPRRCLVIILILLVVATSVLVATLIGYWLGEDQRSFEQRDQLMLQLTPDSSRTSKSTPESALLLTEPITLSPVPVLRQVTERLIPLEGRKRKEISVEEVHPPILESYELLEELHSSRESAKHSDSLLVPLPLHVLPLHYELLLDLTRFSDERFMRGNLSIHLDSYGNSSDDEIIFHVGPKINIERIRITKDGKRVYPKTVKREDNKKLARIFLKEQLRRGKYILEMEYNTTICDAEEEGVHCVREQKENNTVFISSFTTKFEPTLARSFMPCWDEPGIKAIFNISVLHRSRFTVLSNMPRRKGEDPPSTRGPDSIVLTSFQETPPMSTYLLALAIGEFTPFEMRTERNIPLTIWTHKEDYLSARFAANFSPLMFDKHEEQFEVPYPLPKMDFVAARNFPVGGMENWGLIIFDYRALLMEHVMEENANLTVDRRHTEYKIEKIVTHELSHQWFGNLVTMRNWEDIWLNEGFATFFVLDFLHDEHPKLTDNEYYMRMTRLFNKQSAEERLPLVREMSTERDVEQTFHATHLYSKGCVFVRMIKDLVSDLDFRSGVKRYLRKNAFRSVSRDELWASLPAHADHGAEHEPLNKVMEGWLVNEGIPAVTVIRNYETDMITVSQSQARENDYKAFLKAENPERKKREIEETTPFDDTLFEDFPKVNTVMKKNHKKKRRRKNNRPYLPSPPQAEDRREELRLPRRALEPSDTWSIPFSYMFGSVKSTEGQVMRQFWLKNRSLSFADVELAASHPLVGNPDWVFPYRVNYDHNNWKMLARQLHHNPMEIPAKSRMQLIVDSEMFLAQSEVPHIYVYLLGYLAREPDLGVALMGLDAVHRLADQWRGSRYLNSFLLYLSPVVAQFDKLLDASQNDPEEAALWLVEPTRLSKLYQLRCVTNLASCDHKTQTKRWLQYPSSSNEDVHRQATAVCHYLYTNQAEVETALLESQLRSHGTQWSTAVQLAACARNDRVARLAAKQIVHTRNAAVFASSLQSDFSLHYNKKFRNALWHQIGRLAEHERVFLFSANQTAPMPVSKILLHSVRTEEELKQVKNLVPHWSGEMSKHVEYLERKLSWMTSVEAGVLRDFFNGDVFI